MNRENLFKNCTLCPRNCKVDRTKRTGYCGAGDKLKVARASLHLWEEPCISGENGSGTVFFSHCNLKCVYCQNHQISQGEFGVEITPQRLSEIFFELKEKGAHNINLVTPTHFVPLILDALDLSKDLNIPIVYNTSGYETPQTIEMLRGYVDIFLTDLKYYDERFSKKYSFCPNYFEKAKEALEKMVEMVGKPKFDENGMLLRGVIVRHMALPNLTDDTKRILKYLNRTYGNDVLISIMSQYTPFFKADEFSEIANPISKDDYEDILDYAQMLGIENGYIQEGESAKESFIPSFCGEGVVKGE